jgi:methyl-accepting chemotaxis protein
LREGLGAAEGKVNEYDQLINETVAKTESITNTHKVLDESARKYMENCYTFLTTQGQQLDAEIKAGAEAAKLSEQAAKLGLINDIIDLGNQTRIANFKGQALNEPKMIQDALKSFSDIDKKIEEVRAKTVSETSLRQLADTKAAANAYRQAMNELIANLFALQELNGKRLKVGNEVLSIVSTSSQAGMGQMREMATNAIATITSASLILLIGLGISIALGIGLAVLTTLSITRPINRVSEGLADGAEQVAAASGQVASASQQLAEGSSQQAAAIEETSSSLEEMSSMTKQNADHANQANHLMKEVHQTVAQANQSMVHLTGSMLDISKASEETQKIIKTIDEIAFQTNLLALNAAVEAARAGEAGAGFAVVADEVRNLAMRAAEAAKNTASLIEGTVKTVKAGCELVEATSKEFSGVTASVSKSGELVGEINEASREQAQGIDQINRAATEMDQVTQRNAANAEESAAAAEEMNAQAEQMKAFVAELMTLVHGNSNGAASGRKAQSPSRHYAASGVVAAEGRNALPANAGGRGRGKGKAKSGDLMMPRELRPDQVIPLEREEFEDF